jgi:hypothetical protein
MLMAVFHPYRSWWKGKYTCLILVLGLTVGGWGKMTAQAVQASLQFATDSIRIGEVVSLEMVLTHPPEVAVVFPDSGRAFRPFEIVKTQASLTHTYDDLSHDTLRLWVRTFRLMPVQQLRLPYQYVMGADTFTRKVDSDSIFLKQQVRAWTPAPPFRKEEGIIPVSTPPDLRLQAMITLAILLSLMLLSWLLWKPIQRAWARLRLRREWQSFSKRIKTAQRQLTQPDKALEALNQAWKDYLDPRQQYALRSLSTTELSETLPGLPGLSPQAQGQLLDAARAGDLALYAEQAFSPEQMTPLFQHTRTIMEQVYKKRLREAGRRASV